MKRNGSLPNLNMESKKVSNNKIFQQFAYNYRDSPIQCWTDFIIEQDIGIEAIGDKVYYIWEYEYIVTDEKKWFLSKLKYGI